MVYLRQIPPEVVAVGELLQRILNLHGILRLLRKLHPSGASKSTRIDLRSVARKGTLLLIQICRLLLTLLQDDLLKLVILILQALDLHLLAVDLVVEDRNALVDLLLHLLLLIR